MGVYAGQDKEDQPIWFAVNGHVVLRPDGSDTGLALTPALKLSDQGGEVEADTSRWWVTHIPSGKHVPGAGAYDRPEEAQLLAGVLAQLDWTRSETELTTAEIRRVGATVSAFNGALAEEKVGQARPGKPMTRTTEAGLAWQAHDPADTGRGTVGGPAGGRWVRRRGPGLG